MSVLSKTDTAFQKCIDPACGYTCGVEEVRTCCPTCGDLLDLKYDWDRLPVPRGLSDFEAKWSRRSDPLCFSGVWRFRDLLPFASAENIVTIGEGQTLLQWADRVADFAWAEPSDPRDLSPKAEPPDTGAAIAKVSRSRPIIQKAIVPLGN